MGGFGQQIAERTWKQGFLHLTVDGDGLVSLWDQEIDSKSYIKLPLTAEQQKLLETTMKKGGETP